VKDVLDAHAACKNLPKQNSAFGLSLVASLT